MFTEWKSARDHSLLHFNSRNMEFRSTFRVEAMKVNKGQRRWVSSRSFIRGVGESAGIIFVHLLLCASRQKKERVQSSCSKTTCLLAKLTAAKVDRLVNYLFRHGRTMLFVTRARHYEHSTTCIVGGWYGVLGAPCEPCTLCLPYKDWHLYYQYIALLSSGPRLDYFLTGYPSSYHCRTTPIHP